MNAKMNIPNTGHWLWYNIVENSLHTTSLITDFVIITITLQER